MAAAILIALLTVFVMTGCKDQENMAIAESNTREIAAIPISVTVVEPVSIRDVVFLPGETEACKMADAHIPFLTNSRAWAW